MTLYEIDSDSDVKRAFQAHAREQRKTATIPAHCYFLLISLPKTESPEIRNLGVQSLGKRHRGPEDVEHLHNIIADYQAYSKTIVQVSSKHLEKYEREITKLKRGVQKRDGNITKLNEDMTKLKGPLKQRARAGQRIGGDTSKSIDTFSLFHRFC